MENVSITLTVCFDGQFWIGLFEKQIKRKLYVAKWTFGAEPKEEDVLLFICNQYKNLVFSPPVSILKNKPQKKNPKTLQRQVKKSLEKKEIGSKSQQALKKQIEERKIERKTYTKEQKEKEEEISFLLKQQKKKEKHKGH